MSTRQEPEVRSQERVGGGGEPHHLRKQETTIMPASAEQVATDPTVAGTVDRENCQSTQPQPQKRSQSAAMPAMTNQNLRSRSFAERVWSVAFWLACISISFASIDLLNESLRHLLTASVSPASTTMNQVAAPSTSNSSLEKAAMMLVLLWIMQQVQPATSPLSTSQAGTQVNAGGNL